MMDLQTDRDTWRYRCLFFEEEIKELRSTVAALRKQERKLTSANRELRIILSKAGKI